MNKKHILLKFNSYHFYEISNWIISFIFFRNITNKMEKMKVS